MTQPIRAAVAPSNKNISPYEKPNIVHCLLEEKLNSFETLESSNKGQNGNYRLSFLILNQSFSTLV